MNRVGNFVIVGAVLVGLLGWLMWTTHAYGSAQGPAGSPLASQTLSSIFAANIMVEAALCALGIMLVSLRPRNSWLLNVSIGTIFAVVLLYVGAFAWVTLGSPPIRTGGFGAGGIQI
jgi:hypothetical protein